MQRSVAIGALSLATIVLVVAASRPNPPRHDAAFPAQFTVIGTVRTYNVVNVSDHPNLVFSENAEERAEQELAVSLGRWRAEWSVEVESWEVAEDGKTAEGATLGMRDGTITVVRGIITERPGAGFGTSHDLTEDEAESIAVGHRYRFLVGEDQWFRQHFYILGAYEPLE